MNADQIEGKWKQFAGSFREKFGRFTNDDMAGLNGKREQLIGNLQEKYGDTKEDAERRLNEWCESVRSADERASKSAGSSQF